MLLRRRLFALLVAFIAATPALCLAQKFHSGSHRDAKVEKQYRKFQHWYRTHAAVDVYINGASVAHLTATLEAVRDLLDRDVLVRDIVVIGGSSISHLDVQIRNRLGRAMNRNVAKGGSTSHHPQLIALANSLSLGTAQAMSDVKARLSELEVSASPVWVVTKRGQRHIFEGVPSIRNYFNSSGGFTGARGMGLPIGTDSGAAARISGPSKVPLLPPQDSGSPLAGFLPVYRYRPLGVELKPGTGTADFRPDCREKSVRRVPVTVYTEELDKLDFTFYNAEDDGQRRKAKKLPRNTAPFLEGDIYNPWRRQPALLQQYARFFDIRCLPTRIHFVADKGRRFEEYREGDAAWD